MNFENSIPPLAVYKSRSPSESASKNKDSIVSDSMSFISVNLSSCINDWSLQ